LYDWQLQKIATVKTTVHVKEEVQDNNNNNLIYIAAACRMTSEALADSSSGVNTSDSDK